MGICVKTLHRWEKSKKLLSSFRTFGNHRRYLKYDVLKIKNKEKRINIGYSRVSSYDQKDDLERQSQYLLQLTHKDRLLRFGTELIIGIAKKFGTNIIFINHDENETFESTLAKDVLEIITVFSARLYGSRSHKNKKSVALAT